MNCMTVKAARPIGTSIYCRYFYVLVGELLSLLPAFVLVALSRSVPGRAVYYDLLHAGSRIAG